LSVSFDRFRDRSRVRFVTAAATLALGGAAVLLGREAAVAVKGRVAVVLIESAWRARLRDNSPHRPWPWADFTPAGRLVVPRLGIDRPVLSDATGRTLAFGLGHLPGTAWPGDPGLAAIAGHRNSWAEFLRDLRDGDEIVLTGPRGTRRYTVVARKVVARPASGVWGRDDDGGSGGIEGSGEIDGSGGIDGSAEGGGGDAIVLITCWPFDGLRQGPLRYLVIGRPRRGAGAARAGS
jgi:sortase A